MTYAHEIWITNIVCNVYTRTNDLIIAKWTVFSENVNMKKFARGRKGLSTPVTTLIILVVSVLLATVVTYYAINVTTTRVQEESLYMSKVHIWVNTSGSWSEGAFVLVNTGGRDVVLDKISIRGQESDWSNVYFWTTKNVTVFDDLEVTSNALSGNTFNITVQRSERTFNNASYAAKGDITLKSGWTMVAYIKNPDSIGVNDIGLSIGVTTHTANAEYYKECNVEAAQ